MAYTVPTSFEKFVENISLTGDHTEVAEARRKRIVELLESDFTILDSFPTGSIPKRTALKSHADLDVIVVLHYGKHIEGKQPSELLAAVRKPLAAYKTGVRRNGQAVTLSYETWPDVDIVPVSRIVNNDNTVNYYHVPDMNTETWIKSRPRRHAANVADRVTTGGPKFLPLIRMIKEWNRVHSEYLSSYHIEAIALEVCEIPISDYSWAVFSFFEKAVAVVMAPLWYEDAFVDDYLDTKSRAEAVKRLETAADRARSAWHSTYGTNNNHSGAIEEWRIIFGDRFPAYG